MNFKVVGTRQHEADKEVLKTKYFELINLKSIDGCYPTKEQWIRYCDEDLVVGGIIQGSVDKEWKLKWIHIKSRNHEDRIDYKFVNRRIIV